MWIEDGQNAFKGTIRPNNLDKKNTITSALYPFPPYNDCIYQAIGNSYQCGGTDIGHLLFESQDSDTYDRQISPVYIFDGSGFTNILNSFRDHSFNGYAFGQKRLSRFVSQIATNQDYVVQYSGTPPERQRFLFAGRGGGMAIKIPYTSGSMQVSVGGTVVEANIWDENIKLSR